MIALLAVVLAAELPQFRPHTIAADLKGGYQVVVKDMNRDGKPDLIALASGMPELVWYQNPGTKGETWARHVIGGPFSRMINLAAEDVNGDGIPEIVLAHGFANVASNSTGIVSLLESQGDLSKGWTVREIDRLTTSHRIRVLRLDGKPVFVNAPLTGAKAAPPDYRDKVPIVLYRPGVWKREVIATSEEGVMHGIWVGRWRGEREESIVVASFLGITRYKPGRRGDWERIPLTKGHPDAWPKSGSSDVDITKDWMAAIEPWHGNFVAVYDSKNQRQVIDDTLVDGHTIIAADLDGDKQPEIIAGFRGGERGVNLYRRERSGWKRMELERGGMSAAACVAGDFNSDGRNDVACIGSATANLKWYENLGTTKQ